MWLPKRFLVLFHPNTFTLYVTSVLLYDIIFILSSKTGQLPWEVWRSDSQECSDIFTAKFKECDKKKQCIHSIILQTVEWNELLIRSMESPWKSIKINYNQGRTMINNDNNYEKKSQRKISLHFLYDKIWLDGWNHNLTFIMDHDCLFAGKWWHSIRLWY